MNTLILLHLLKKFSDLRKGVIKSCDMIEHTFILMQDKQVKKIRKIALPKEISDEAIKGVMNWQKKQLKQN